MVETLHSNSAHVIAMTPNHPKDATADVMASILGLLIHILHLPIICDKVLWQFVKILSITDIILTPHHHI